jgi:serine/threonine protein phosphatase PrpC
MPSSPKATPSTEPPVPPGGWSAEPRPATAEIDVFGLTDTGRVRRENQDQFLIASLHKLLRVHQSSIPPDDLTPLVTESRGFVFVVADGVAGRPDGAQASGTVIRAIAHYVTHLTDLYRRLDADREVEFLAQLERAVLETHDVLLEEGRREYGGKGAATTLTMLFALWPRGYVVHLGDSSCFRLREGRLERMTRDQTVAEDLVRAGALRPSEARQSPLSNVLASALGGPEATPLTLATDARRDDVVLLCTDGLTKHVTEDEIAERLRTLQSSEQVCRDLVRLANERGGTDNVTVLIGRVKNKPAA